MTTKDPTEPSIFCRHCDYALVGLSEHRCPECGRPFDPENRRTFSRRPRYGRLRRFARRVSKVLLSISLVLGVVAGWLYWGWRGEQAILAPFQAFPQAIVVVRPLGPAWLAELLGDRVGFLLDRVASMQLGGVPLTEAHVAQLARLSRLETLDLSAVQVDPSYGGGTIAVIRSIGPALQECSCDGGLDRLDCASEATLAGLHGEPQEDLASSLPVIDDAIMARVANLTHLRALYLENTHVTDAQMQHLAGLPRLERLFLRNTSITGEGLESLASLKQLQFLDLSDTLITDAGLKHLAALSNLKELGLVNTGIRDAGLVHLRNLRTLQALYLGHTYVTPAGAAVLKDIPLQNLDLSQTPANDADLAALLAIKTLKVLDLHRTLVGNDGLQILSQLPALEYVDLDRSLVTTEAAERWTPPASSNE